MSKFGLTDEEVLESKAKFGDNGMSEIESEGFAKKLLANFSDPIIRILLVAFLINLVFVFTGNSEWYEAVGIAVAVLLATFVSTFSEYSNENAFRRLQSEAAQIKCKAYRNGEIAEIPIDALVVGDCVLLQAGDKVPADGVLADGEIRVDQSALNGESKEAPKAAAPADYAANAAELEFLNGYDLFRGSVVCSGSAVMRVGVVGDKTVYGQIAKELQSADDRDSPMKVKLTKLARLISRFGYIAAVLIAVAFVFKAVVIDNHFDAGAISLFASDWQSLLKALANAVILAVVVVVMAVPEGLPLMVAIVSSQNMGKMLRDNVLVRKIAGIETAGSLNLLFSDKTGTITKGRLEAVSFIDGAAAAYRSLSELLPALRESLLVSITNNTGAMRSGDKIIGGNATERALLAFAAGEEAEPLACLKSLPFNSANKYSAAEIVSQNGAAQTLIKGAPEIIIGRCAGYLGSAGEVIPTADFSALEHEIDLLASRAIRVLALAVTTEKIEGDALPAGSWTLIGVIGIRDDVRPDAVEAIAKAQSAGVQVVMITGDRKDTATAIAREANLLREESDIVLTSSDLRELSDDELKALLPNIRVIARAFPADKSRLVRLGQGLNLVVGMTGDGVNDSPALKQADVGFGMGGGTEVAKEAADIVIMDDNFASIAKAILYGRTIFNNIRKFIAFQLTINLVAVFVSFVMPLLGYGSPLTIIQILWVNLVIDTLAAIAFGSEPALSRYMEERPKNRSESLVSRKMWSQIAVVAAYVFAASVVMLSTGFLSGFFRETGADGVRYIQTAYFAFFMFAAIFNSFNARTDSLYILDSIGKNVKFFAVMGIITAVQLLMVYLGGETLQCFGLTPSELIAVIVMGIIVIPVDVVRKGAVKLFAGK